jgi:C-terminal peptidase prc
VIGWWLAGCEPEVIPGPTVLARERMALREAERRVLLAEAEAALAAGDWSGAARIVALERETWPEDFGPMAERIRAEGPPEASVLLEDPRLPRAPRIPRDWAIAEARARGATLAQGSAVWTAVRDTWVVAPDVAAVTRATRRHLAAVAADEGFRARYGALVVPPGGDEPPDVFTAAIAAGWPEPVVVVEGTDAALAALDGWTRPVWPSERTTWEAHHAGVVLGVGVTLAEAPDGAVVVTLPTPGGPAWVGGVHAGDRVEAVDGVAVASLPAPRAAAVEAALSGAPGTRVSLSLQRDGEWVTRVVERAAVPEETVTGWRRTADGWDVAAAEGVAWVRISAFRPATDEAFDALTEFAAPAVVVLDLRGNGGGDLAAALHVADRFVFDGAMVTLEGRTHPPPTPGPAGELPWNAAAPGHALEGTPVVVLVDGRTASAAEIVAAILRAHAGALVVGEPTFGKLRSQSLRSDPASGAAWQVTTGRWRVGAVEERVEVDLALLLSPAERRAVDELVARRELPPTHPDGTPVPWLGTVSRRDLPPLTADPAGERALALALALAGD